MIQYQFRAQLQSLSVAKFVTQFLLRAEPALRLFLHSSRTADQLPYFPCPPHGSCKVSFRASCLLLVSLCLSLTQYQFTPSASPLCLTLNVLKEESLTGPVTTVLAEGLRGGQSVGHRPVFRWLPLEQVFAPGVVGHVSEAQMRATYAIKIPGEQPKELLGLWA